MPDRRTWCRSKGRRMARRVADVKAWLQTHPSTEELREAFPQHWEDVRTVICELLEQGDHDELRNMTFALAKPPTRSRNPTKAEQDRLVKDYIQRRMAVDALAQVRHSLATGVVDGPVRFNRWNGTILQRLLFAHDLERKPASAFWYRVLSPLLPQRRFLMTLVAPRGIYCFYSRKLVRELARLIGDRPCLEIAAGDGTLTRFLADEGVDIVATDDFSWEHDLAASTGVVKQGASAALKARQPKAVICSWPPAGNRFERDVFRTGSVDLYIVIGTHHEWSSGDWTAYRAQDAFEMVDAVELGRLVLPLEQDQAVLVFRRKASMA